MHSIMLVRSVNFDLEMFFLYDTVRIIFWLIRCAGDKSPPDNAMIITMHYIPDITTPGITNFRLNLGVTNEFTSPDFSTPLYL